ncbi:hypothetical protein L4G92_02605 [Neisseria sp. ZJ106]|uniref:Uncharacterized protein n=1 Tax=Neisseria lisongii TaxID=2912188 RepID=A0ABY7RJ88_9NEIS|nr:hypothetical protein [Neisseria lisongii]MCF7520944.1 hypothetical protein [Neisseria lisongii]WCL71253.1 hypothetical protein PJU73_07910 [Neisseria lisongii]
MKELDISLNIEIPILKRTFNILATTAYLCAKHNLKIVLYAARNVHTTKYSEITNQGDKMLKRIRMLKKTKRLKKTNMHWRVVFQRAGAGRNNRDATQVFVKTAAEAKRIIRRKYKARIISCKPT